MSELLPEGINESVSGLDADISFEAVDPADTVTGSPVQGVAELGSIGETALGIWELRGGTVTDTEVDELFVVLSGGATIEFLDETRADGSPRMVDVKAGDVMRLVAGSRTRWSVDDHIRKVYIAEA